MLDPTYEENSFCLLQFSLNQKPWKCTILEFNGKLSLRCYLNVCKGPRFELQNPNFTEIIILCSSTSQTSLQTSVWLAGTEN